MLNLEIRFSLPFAYRNAFVSLNDYEHSMLFHLEEGSNEAISTPVDLGVAHAVGGRRLLGQFSFGYTYDPHRRVVTMAGSDFRSSRTMSLTTMPEGTAQVCRQWAAGGGFPDEELRSNPSWNYTTQMTPGLRDIFGELLHTVNERVIESLSAQADLIVQVRKNPPALSAEEHAKFLMVYRDGQFLGLHEPGRAYGPSDEIVTIESVFGGEVTLKYREAIANVIGSTNDPKIDGLHWINLWAHQFGDPVICTSYQSFGFDCVNKLVGGHVISGTIAKIVQKGSDSVYIFPICDKHNKNDNVHMLGLKYLKGVWLRNYMGR